MAALGVHVPLELSVVREEAARAPTPLIVSAAAAQRSGVPLGATNPEAWHLVTKVMESIDGALNDDA